MKNAPAFSVITPSFNQGSFIQATLDSVRQQGLADFEHLIYDPGSKDGSVDTIRSYCDSFEPAEFMLGQDKSQTNAINLGFSRARGDILCWLNSDDTYCDADVLETVQREFAQHPEVDIIYGRGQFVSPQGDVLREAFINRDGANIRQLMSQSLGILQPALFMRKRVFEAAGLLDEKMNFSFDYEYWARCAGLGMKFRFIDRLLARAVIHEDAKTMRDRGTSLREAMEVARRHYGFVASDWVQRQADFQLNDNDGIINTVSDDTGLRERSRIIFEGENAGGLALARYFNNDALMNDTTKKDFAALCGDLFSRAYLSGWDANYFDMGVTLIASIHRHDPDAFIFVFDIGMREDQKAFLGLLRNVILLDKDFAPYRHDWQRNPKNYIFKTILFNHLLGMMPDGCLLLWVDAGVMLLQDPAAVFARIEADDVFFIDHDDSRHWPLFNASFTSDSAIEEGRFTYAELAGPHVCSCLFGCKAGADRQEIFSLAAELSANHKIAVGDKHPPESAKRNALSKQEQRHHVQAFSTDSRVAADLSRIRHIFGYYGHRQDQSILSLLAARLGAPISSAKIFCPANDTSSQISKENWFEGVSSSLGDHGPVPEDQDGITFHHRGLIKDFSGLAFSFPMAPVAGILGNGPSLGDVDLAGLKHTDSFGMNAAYRFWQKISWYPSFYSCLDTVVGMSHKEAIRTLIRNRKMLGIKAFLLRQNLVDWLAETGDLEGVINFDLIRFGFRAFTAEPVTTGSHTLAWAMAMGFENAFVSGVDCQYVEKISGAELTEKGTLEIKGEEENPNYFFADYQRAGDQYNIPNPSKDLHIRSWRNVADLLDKDRVIMNVSAISRMDAFPKCSLDGAFDLFGQTSKEPQPAFGFFDYSGSAQAIEPIAALQDLMGLSGSDVQGLITYDDPAVMLAATLANKADPGAALADWEAQAGTCLALLRKARHRLSIVERSRMAGDPEAYRAMLKERLPDQCLSGILRENGAPPDPLCVTIGELYLHQSPAAQRLLAELRASGLRPDGIPAQAATDPPAVLAVYHALSDRAAGLETALGSLRAQDEKAQTRAQTLRHEARLLNEQLAQLQATTETYFKEAETLRAALAERDQAAEALRGELEKIYRSKSWRVTEPLRGMRRVTQLGQNRRK